MPTTEIRRLTPEDYRACVEQAAWTDVEHLCEHGVSLWVSGELIGCGGIMPYWPGVGEAWVAAGPGARGRGLIGIRVMRAWIAGHKEYKRIQADVLAEKDKLMYLLGFEFESKMPKYGPGGETYHRYVRFP